MKFNKLLIFCRIYQTLQLILSKNSSSGLTIIMVQRTLVWNLCGMIPLLTDNDCFPQTFKLEENIV